MDMIQFIQKARQLKVLGFDSYQGIVATHGIDKADQILSYLLEASELGFNLNDLKTLFNNLNGLSDKKEEIVSQEQVSIVAPVSETVETDLWQLVKERFAISFDIEKFVMEYQNPCYPQALDIEDFLMCLGVDWSTANSRMRGASGKISSTLLGKGYTRKSETTITTISPSTRLVFDKSNGSVIALLETLSKFVLKEYTPLDQKMMTILEWMNDKFTITRNGELEKWSLPKDVFTELSNGVNNLLIKYNIGSEYVSKTATTRNAGFTSVDALDVSKGFCEIVYRDVVLSLYNEDVSFREMVQEFCSKKGIVYTKDFEELVLDQANKTRINQYDFKNFTMKSVRPFHQLVIFHLLEKLNAERNALKVEPLFS